MKRIAFLTMDNIEGFFAYDHLAIEPLARRGWHVEEIPWRCRHVPSQHLEDTQAP